MLISSQVSAPVQSASPAQQPLHQPTSHLDRPADLVRHQTARCWQQLVGGFRLLHDRYVDAGLCRANRSGLRVMPFHLWPETQIFVGLAGSEVIGTVSLVLDQGNSLPLEKVFLDDVERERKRRGRVAELSSLAISPQDARSKEAFARLTSIAVQFARFQGVDQLLAAVHPRHARVYQRAMGFRQISETAPHGGVLGNPAVLISAPLNEPDIIGPSWQHWYFGNRFQEDELTPTLLSQADRRFFRARVHDP